MHCINTYCVMYTIINFIYIILLYIYYFKQYYLYIKYKKILYFIYIQYIIYHSMKSLIYFLILAIFWLKFLTYCLKSMLANSSIVALACPISPLLLISFRIFRFIQAIITYSTIICSYLIQYGSDPHFRILGSGFGILKRIFEFIDGLLWNFLLLFVLIVYGNHVIGFYIVIAS